MDLKDAHHRNHPDSDLVSLKESYEVAYWTKAFGKTEQQLRAGVAAVGHGVGALRRHFGLTK